ncbi:hypothetical protein BJV77DRAFT_601729 [Russula vinacea]|nr:hypothetical protein BJV77DRAFT_601729 [Russula vinacea]
MYLDRAIEEDTNMVESWKGDADGMLVFTGLFSAAVAALLALSVPNIQPNSQDTSSFYLAHIYQQLSTQPNGSQVPIPSSLSDPTQPFTPPTLGIWVNGLWFMSLVMSLTCALLATLLQQWARRYQRVAYPRYNPHKRARIRAFYKHGVDKLHIPWMVELLPALLHISLFLFFAGLSVFLFGVDFTIFKVVTSWIGLCVILYACLTFLPVIRKDSPIPHHFLRRSHSVSPAYDFFSSDFFGGSQTSIPPSSPHFPVVPTFTISFRTAWTRRQKRSPSKCPPILTIVRCCGRSSH